MRSDKSTAGEIESNKRLTLHGTASIEDSGVRLGAKTWKLDFDPLVAAVDVCRSDPARSKTDTRVLVGVVELAGSVSWRDVEDWVIRGSDRLNIRVITVVMTVVVVTVVWPVMMVSNFVSRWVGVPSSQGAFVARIRNGAIWVVAWCEVGRSWFWCVVTNGQDAGRSGVVPADGAGRCESCQSCQEQGGKDDTCHCE